MAHSFPENRKIMLDIIKEINPKNILDVGIGDGDYAKALSEIAPTDGLEIYEPYRNEQWDFYDNVFIGDMRTFDFPKYDLYLFIDSLEHISKEDGKNVLDKLKGNILINVPVNYKQGENLAPYDKHLAEYTFDDFKGKDYSNERSKIVWITK
jgi:hypothetical protein